MANSVSIVISAVDRTRGFKDVLTNFQRLEDQGKALGTALTYVGSTAAVALVGSLVALTASSIKSADEMGKAAQKAGMAVEDFSQLSYAAGLADVSQQDLITASKALSQEMVKLGRGSESVMEQMLAQADVFAKMEDGANKTALAVALFGKSGQTLIPLLNQGSDAIRRQMQWADKLGLTISSEFANKADEFGDNLDRIKASLTGVGNEIAQAALPTLIEFTDASVLWVKKAREMGTWLDQLAAKLAGMEDKANTSGMALKVWAAGALALFMPLGGAELLKKSGAPPDHILPDQNDKLDRAFKSPPIQMPTTDTIQKWVDRYGDALEKAKDLERQFRLEQFEGTDQDKLRLDYELENRIQQITELKLSEEDSIDAMEQAWIAYYAKRQQLEKQDQQQRRQVQAAYTAEASQFFGNLANTAKAFGKKGFEAWKAFASAQALIDTYGAANKAYHALAGIPIVGPALGAAAAAAAIAAGLANVSMINSAKPAGQAHGGLDFVPRESTFLLNRGERVIQPAQNVRLTKMLDDYESGSFGGNSRAPQAIELHLDGRRIAEWINDGTRDGRIQIHARAVA